MGGQTVGRWQTAPVRAVVQRVASASVTVDGTVVSAIGTGLLVLVGVSTYDSEADARSLAGKISGLRIFPDTDGAMNLSLADVAGSVLVVSQFTLYGDASRGRRPSFTAAAPGPVAEPLIEAVTRELERAGVPVERGRFGAVMSVESVNQGPVTILLETKNGRHSVLA